MAPAPAVSLSLRTRRLLRRRGPALLLSLALVALAAVAVLNPGVATTRVDVNDGGIWVTSPSRQLIGHLNYESRSLDGVIRTGSATFDVAQYRDTVTYHDEAVNAVAPVDAAAMQLGAATSLSERSQVVQGGNRLGILDAAKGRLWVADAAQPADTPLTDTSALAADLEGGVVTAGVDGTVAAIAAGAGRLVTVTRKGLTNQVQSTAIDGLSRSARLSITMVGSRPVAFDAASSTLILPDGSLRPLAAEGVSADSVLQQPGADADHVLLATGTELVSVPLAGGAVTRLASPAPSAGVPAAPVRLHGCEYAAWATSGGFLRRCDGSPDLVRLTNDRLQKSSAAQFRTNRDLIVLNDLGDGTVWLPDKNLLLAADWDKVEDELKKDENQEDSPQTSDEIADPERRTTNTPPIANPDTFGLRAGRATTLDVLANDSDSDGDVLTASPVDQPKFGKVERSRGGQALRIDVPAEASGRATFGYSASDGKALATASVTVDVHPDSVNSGPKQERNPTVKLGAGAEVSYNVLPDWRDPDGDPIYLVSATSNGDNLQVRYREEGTVTVRNLGAKPGLVQVKVVVADDREQTEGVLTLSVQASGNLPPIANGDFTVVQVGETALLQPLANDTDPNGDSLSLVGVSTAPANSTATPALDAGTISFSARVVGSYSLTYSVTDGPSAAIGVIRVDVVQADDGAAVVAEDDLVLLPSGGQALSTPLNNDTDPTGGVLVVQSITLPDDPYLKVTLVDHHLLRISSQVALEEPESITYTASNGVTTATAKVLVVPTKALDTKRPPLLEPDRTKVRVGDIASVAVLENDRSPAGLRMSVDAHLEYNPNPDVGTPFVTGNQVRIQAGTVPGFLRVAYTVLDSAGNMATSTVLFEVVADGGANTAPRPEALTAWAVSGQTVRVPVPLAGVDPDGDSVTLVGIDQAPGKGTATLGVDWLEYTPAVNQVGSDVFTYIVEDRLGKQATARVRVGIAPPSVLNQNPGAVPDTLLVRPGRVLTVPVIDNDTDPDGDELTLDPDGVVTDEPRLQPRVDGSSIVVTTPDDPDSYVLTYRVSDGRGGTDVGTLTLNVTADAPLLAPQARDDTVAADDVPTDGSPVVVDVLANDADPDGDSSLLKLDSDEPGVKVVSGKLQITPATTRRLVVYRITDQDGLTGHAVVSVPGTERTRPRLDTTRLPVRVRAGEQVRLDLRDLVITRDQRSPHLVDAATVRLSLGLGGAPAVPDDHTITFTVAKDFSGDAGVSLSVSDGLAADRSALTANLTIPLRVQAGVNQPPKLVPTPIQLAAGEAKVLDLLPMVHDPDDADPATFHFSLVDVPAKLDAQLVDGNRLQVRAEVSHALGSAGSVTVAVDDGSGAVTAQIPVTVLSSTAPLIAVSDAYFGEANAGTEIVVDVNKYAINPFKNAPLRIMKTVIRSGEVTSADVKGTRLVVVLPDGFHGDVLISYYLMDATGDQSRMVEGRVRMVVRDRPDPPSDVQVSPTGPGSALVVFQPGANNGAPITVFTLTDTTTGDTYSCKVASCPLTRLENGLKHAFSVVAHNDVGDSDPSPASAAVLIDVAPGRPDPPTGDPGDGSITVHWNEPVHDGSGVARYLLYVNGSGSPITVDGDHTSHTITGLTNGQSYRVAVQAENKSEQQGPVSALSDAIVPFGRPDPPRSVSVENQAPGDAADLARIKVSWQYPSDDNGRDWDQVRITSTAGEKVIDSDGSKTSAEIEVPAARSSTLSVALHTAGGWSEARAVDFQALALPVQLDAPTVTATGRDGQVQVSGAQTKAGNGYTVDQLAIQFAVDGGDWHRLDSDVIGDLTNGRAVTISFRQIADGVGFSAAGAAVSAQPVTPYGPPLAPDLSAAPTSDGVTFTWHSKADNGGPKVTRIVLDVNGDESTSSDLNGSRSYDGPTGQLFTGTAAACYDDGTCTRSERVQVKPNGSYSVQSASCQGGEDPAVEEGSGQECHTFEVRATDWLPQVRLTCSFDSDVDSKKYTFSVDASGGWTRSGARTVVVDQDELNKWIGSRLVCGPA